VRAARLQRTVSIFSRNWGGIVGSIHGIGGDAFAALFQVTIIPLPGYLVEDAELVENFMA
jgi:hypothetical protein